MIKIDFFDKINNIPTVNTVKKLLQRGDGEIFFTYNMSNVSLRKTRNRKTPEFVIDF